MLRVLALRHKTLHHETPGALRTDTLGDTHAVRHHTVDQHTERPRVRERHVKERPHEDTQAPHEQGGKQIRQTDTRRAEVHEIVHVVIIQDLVSQQHQHHRHRITIHHAHQVHEARIAHEPRISVEQPEPRHTQDNEAHQRIQQREGPFHHHAETIEYPIR